MAEEIVQAWPLELESVIGKLSSKFSSRGSGARKPQIILDAKDLHEALRVFRQDGFDYLADVSSAHYPERNEIELIYR